MKNIITHAEGILLKRLGFDEWCKGYYNGKGDLRYKGITVPLGLDEEEMSNSFLNSKYCSAPTYEEVFAWLKKYNKIKKEVIIKHVDGKTNVRAKIFNINNKISLEWKFKDMCYGRELTFSEALELVII